MQIGAFLYKIERFSLTTELIQAVCIGGFNRLQLY